MGGRWGPGVLICFNVTKRESFEAIKIWVDNIDKHAPENIKRVICGNKVDLTELREVPQEECEKMAKEYGLDYFETSAMTG